MSINKQIRDLFSGSGVGTYLVPQADPLFARIQKYYAPLLGVVRSEQVNDNRPMKVTVTNSTALGMTLQNPEGQTVTEDDDSFTYTLNPAIGATVYGITNYSRQIAEDSAWSLDGLLRDTATDFRWASAVERGITLAVDKNGAALQGNVVGGLLGQTSAVVTGAAGTLATGPTLAQLTDVQGAVDYRYASNGVWLFSYATKLWLQQQVGSDGRRLYPELKEGQLLGNPFVINNSVPSVTTASSKAILFGDPSSAYAVRHTGLNLKTLKERYADVLKLALLSWTRISSASLDVNAVAALETAAS